MKMARYWVCLSCDPRGTWEVRDSHKARVVAICATIAEALKIAEKMNK